MQTVLLATLPGVVVLTWFFGPGTLINILFGALLPWPANISLWRDGEPAPYLATTAYWSLPPCCA